MTNQRILYYVPWCITDGSVIASGLGYNGLDLHTKKHRWDRIISIRIFNVEFGISPAAMMIVLFLTILSCDIGLESHGSYMVETLRI